MIHWARHMAGLSLAERGAKICSGSKAWQGHEEVWYIIGLHLLTLGKRNMQPSKQHVQAPQLVV